MHTKPHRESGLAANHRQTPVREILPVVTQPCIGGGPMELKKTSPRLLAAAIACLLAGAAAPALAKGKKDKPVAAPAAAEAVAPAAGPAKPAAKVKVDDAFLVKAAEDAIKRRDYARAVPLWRGVVTMRPAGDPIVWRLIEAWQLAGQFDDAKEEVERYALTNSDPGEQKKIKETLASLAEREIGFGSGLIEAPSPNEAAKLFQLGRAAFKKKRYEEAILYFKAGSVVAPDLAGNYRELGQAFAKMGQTKEADAFFLRYLRLRPASDNANEVRKLISNPALLGTLSVATTLPCTEVWISGWVLKVKLPLKSLKTAPGNYKLLCVNDEYHFRQFITATVTAGGTTNAEFSWALISNQLREPYGRVAIENPDPRAAGKLIDMSLWDLAGVPVPQDRRALRVVLTADDGSGKRKEELLRLEPGKTYVVKW